MNGKTILYVEDNEYNLKMVRQLLARTTYRLIEATDGELGVATAIKEVPDLILMDIQLPKMSGLDATRRLRAEPATAAIPIIVITSFALSGDEQKAKDAGATAYMAKPYSPREVVTRVKTILRRCRPKRELQMLDAESPLIVDESRFQASWRSKRDMVSFFTPRRAAMVDFVAGRRTTQAPSAGAARESR